MAVTGEESEPLYLDATALEPKFKDEVGKLQLRALFYGGAGLDGYSTPSNVTINPDVGGAKDAAAEVGPGTVDLLTGNYTVSRSDFTLPAPIGSVTVSRTHSSRDAGSGGDTTVLGRGWKPTSLVEEAGGADWRSVREVPPTAEEAEEGFGGYALLTDLEGYELAFEKEGESYVTPPEATGWTLSGGLGTFTLADPSGNKTAFSNGGSGAEYLPSSISVTGSGRQLGQVRLRTRQRQAAAEDPRCARRVPELLGNLQRKDRLSRPRIQLQTGNELGRSRLLRRPSLIDHLLGT